VDEQTRAEGRLREELRIVETVLREVRAAAGAAKGETLSLVVADLRARATGQQGPPPRRRCGAACGFASFDEFARFCTWCGASLVAAGPPGPRTRAIRPAPSHDAKE
jgi:hypothetical protein